MKETNVSKVGKFMKIKTSQKQLTISACDFGGDVCKFIKIDGATAQNFENAIKAFLATFDYNELEIIGGQVVLKFDYRID